MRFMPWSRISSGVEFPSTASDCRCIFRCSMSIPLAIAANIARLTALGVQVHITEMDVSLPIDANGQARRRRSAFARPTFIAASCGHACKIPAAPRFRPGDSPTNIRGSARIRTARAAQALPFDRSLQTQAGLSRHVRGTAPQDVSLPIAFDRPGRRVPAHLSVCVCIYNDFGMFTRCRRVPSRGWTLIQRGANLPIRPVKTSIPQAGHHPAGRCRYFCCWRFWFRRPHSI